MKSHNIVKRLEKEGYSIFYKKWGYWDGIPHVQFEGFNFAIAECVLIGNAYGVNMNFIYNHVQDALYIAKNNNPIILKKIEKSVLEDYYSQYLILSMQDYYLYKKKRYPYDEYYQMLEKIKQELK